MGPKGADMSPLPRSGICAPTRNPGTYGGKTPHTRKGPGRDTVQDSPCCEGQDTVPGPEEESRACVRMSAMFIHRPRGWHLARGP